MKIAFRCFIIVIVCSAWCALSTSDPPKGAYLGQKPPGSVPEVFAPGVISVAGSREHTLAFSPKGDELFFTRGTGWPHNRIMQCAVNKGAVV